MRIHAWTLLLVSVFVGCGAYRVDSALVEAAVQEDSDSDPARSSAPAQTATAQKAMAKKMMDVDPKSIEFKDRVKSNVKVPKGLEDLVFVDTHGSRVALKSYQGKKNVILVFTEGFDGMLCPFCKTQTSRLIANYDKFKERDTEVLVVYPGTRDHIDEFINAALKTEKKQLDKVPFPIVLDEDFVATDFFAIRSRHAHPSTYVIDKNGDVRLAYVGTDMSADRPSVKAILETLDSVN